MKATLISTPTEYLEAFKKKEVKNVSSQMFLCIHNTGSSHLYPKGFDLAWCASSEALKEVLRVHQKNKDVIKHVMTMVGFPIGNCPWDGNWSLAIFVPNKKIFSSMFKPTYTNLYNYYKAQYPQQFYDNPTLKASFTKLQQLYQASTNPVAVLKSLAGISSHSSGIDVANNMGDFTDPDFISAYNTVCSPYGEPCHSKLGLVEFFSGFDSKNYINPERALRAALYNAIDMGALNSGKAIGYNDNNGSGKLYFDEYVLPNLDLNDKSQFTYLKEINFSCNECKC
eukprot:Pgem_evm5s18257